MYSGSSSDTSSDSEEDEKYNSGYIDTNDRFNSDTNSEQEEEEEEQEQEEEEEEEEEDEINEKGFQHKGKEDTYDSIYSNSSGEDFLQKSDKGKIKDTKKSEKSPVPLPNSPVSVSITLKIPWYCFMMVNFESNQKINTWIEESVHPPLSVELHNNKSAPRSKYTKSAAGFWELEMIIGEFPNIKDAVDFVNQWKEKSRGIKSRRDRGIQLFIEKNQQLEKEKKLKCYDKELSRRKQNQTKS